jgi:signal transduction histidine kinase
MVGVVTRFLLKRRRWLLLLALWILVASASLYVSMKDVERHSLEVATAGARNMFQMVLLTREWNATRGPVYLPVTEALQPNPYLNNVPKRDVTTTDDTHLTMVNPSYMTRMISEIAQQDVKIQFHITSLKPIRPANAADDWEREALLAFEQGAKEISQVVSSPQESRAFRYMAPLMVRESCLQCHQAQGYKVGDMRGGISVTQPFGPIEAAAWPTMLMEMVQHGSVFLLVTGLCWWLLELVRAHWRALEAKIEELGRTRDELVQSEKLASLGRMVAGFAHEINTPIGVAVGAVSQQEQTVTELDELLDSEEVREEDLRERLTILRQSSVLALANLRRTAGLIHSFKRSSVDQVSEQVRVFNLRELIDDILFALHNFLKRLPVQVEVQCPAGLAINGVPGWYDQLLTNLLLNAVQHGFEEGTRAGRIGIRVQTEGNDHLCIVVEDDGVGMPPESTERIFEPFFTTRRAHGGTGLGLYICYNIVTAKLGGTMLCESRLGQGATFQIRAPAELRNEPAVSRDHP